MIADNRTVAIAPAVSRGRTPPCAAEVMASGFDGRPWPELIRSRPVVMIPRGPHSPDRPVLDADGWSADPESAQANPAWSAVLREQHLTITHPGGEPWFDGPLLLTREWYRAATTHNAVMLMTGPFDTIAEFPQAALRGALRAVVIPIVFANDT
ncbi:hypothetical protein [Kitasatospora kifunensis]|uniref:Uncharacterized protein n=1 Tax=Kitasatospora kifunensis TaxID=58351 RepID=A0A7W7RBX5_KITKI|nr:hypothetical protein [Kitasatospora kifunensis]MBB4929094.1 hypothetical protein [Kitasatospora kifunensis]